MRELAAMGVDLERVSVVPCGVDAGHFDPGAEGAAVPLGAASGTGCSPAGRLVRRKGYDRAIRAR
ncbi:Glycosyltransferase involved in cell wall biosynthesis OS=Streptomyces griseomycini OX=66895 GN=FHS37_002861 PE=4 SV=1 [Streptomyces griseomycini]